MSREHRLAAIMFTDIQGYTRLMQEDEEEAIKIRSRHREIFQKATYSNRGEIIQYYGDGTLSIFESCVDAVRCAREMQEQFQTKPVIPVRIGIHLGDIVMGDEDIIGDSVNVASRVESLGIPGSVLISGKVYEEIRNKREFEFHRLGAFHFKNDKKPRTIYALSGDKLVIPKRNELQGKLKKVKWYKRPGTLYGLSISVVLILLVAFGTGTVNFPLFGNRIQSLAVLPLNDRIGLDPKEEYIIEGLHEEIIIRLAKAGLRVKPYSVMIHYRNTDKTPEEIGTELNVDGLVEGSVFRSDNGYRIRVQIIEVANQQYVTDPYEARAEFSGIVSLYNDLVSTIAEQISHSLSDEAQEYLEQNSQVDPEAYDLYLRGRSHLSKGSENDLATAIDLFKECLEVDSTFGDAHAALVESYLLLGFKRKNPFQELNQFRYHLDQAVSNDPFFEKNHHLMAMAKIFDNWDWTGAAEELQKAIDANPRSWEPYDTYCQLMWAMGNMDQSIAAGEKAVELDPDAHYAHCDLAWAYYFNRQYDQARMEVNHTIEQFGKDCPHHVGLDILLDIHS
ncbi:MAG: hypothetical protein KDC80_26680, partial [Saprospiraceae bacterium]|nr:hypothetical protein [Saprospiraceae bacterium]